MALILVFFEFIPGFLSTTRLSVSEALIFVPAQYVGGAYRICVHVFIGMSVCVIYEHRHLYCVFINNLTAHKVRPVSACPHVSGITEASVRPSGTGKKEQNQMKRRDC